MRVQVIRLWRNGKRLSAWQWKQTKPIAGELQIIESRGELLNRTMRSAHLFVEGNTHNADGSGQLIPDLIDAAVLSLKGRLMIITGLEVDQEEGTHAQTWWIEILQ